MNFVQAQVQEAMQSGKVDELYKIDATLLRELQPDAGFRRKRCLPASSWVPISSVRNSSISSAFTSHPRPEGRGPRLFFDFLGRELTFFRNSLQGEGREWEKETPCGKGLGSWDT